MTVHSPPVENALDGIKGCRLYQEKEKKMDTIHLFPGSDADTKIKYRFKVASEIQITHEGLNEEAGVSVPSCSSKEEFEAQVRERWAKPLDIKYREEIVTAWGIRFNDVVEDETITVGVDENLTARFGRPIPRALPPWLAQRKSVDVDKFLANLFDIIEGNAHTSIF